MSVKRNKRKNKSIIILKLFIFAIIAYLIIRWIPSSFSGGTRVITVEKDNLIDSIETEAVIMKKETIYKASVDGRVNPIVEEGERIPSGKRIATLVSSKGNAAIEEELKQLDRSIKELKAAKEESEKLTGGGNIEEVIADIKGQIQTKIREEEYEEVYLLKERVNMLTNIDRNELEEESNKAIKNLENKRNKLSDELTKNIKNYTADKGGIISYKIDGFEDIYIANDFEKYSYDKIKIDFEKKPIDTREEDNINKDDPIFKLVDNFRWYMGIKIDDVRDIKDIKDRRALSVKIEGSERQIMGKIIGINEFKNSAVVILEFTKDLHEYYDKRFVKVDLIKSDVVGFKVPKESIIRKNNVKGVYIKDVSGVVRFREIVIIGEDNQNFCIKSGDDNGNVKNDKGESIKTITIFDEIFLNPKNVKEGRIIN